MIPKEKRDADRRICEGATRRPCNSLRHLSSVPSGKDGDVAHAYRSPADGVPYIAIREEDMAAIENAVNRLPAYIDALDDVDRQIAEIDRQAQRHETSGRKLFSQQEDAAATVCFDKAAVLRDALKILRGTT
jgi:hypothetical protein